MSDDQEAAKLDDAAVAARVELQLSCMPDRQS
jgi:hypothetical protein